MNLRLACCAAILLLALPAGAATPREALGVFGHWGAFRDASPDRCFAIAEPEAATRGAWRPSAAIATWPGSGQRGQLHVRLSRTRAAGAPVYLLIGPLKLRLVASGVDAWSSNPRTDAAIVAAMRSGGTLAIVSNAADGRAFTDAYPLRGAATAIDAAALACARRR